jgi:hypothetical protein
MGVSTLALVLIIAGIVVLIVFIGGVLAVRRRDQAQAGVWEEHVAEADAALEQARALDRGWHRETMEEAAREALREQAPDHAFDQLHLILVDDQPGVDEDRAHFVAVGPDKDMRVVLTRAGDRWRAERVQ